jgi:chromosome partitioning protein
VLIDCPPSLGLLTLNGLAAAQEVIVPMQAHFLALQGVGKLLETVRLVGHSVNPGLLVAGVVLCMHDDNTRHTREVVADLEGFFEGSRGADVPWADAQVFRPAVRRNIKVAESPSFGQTIFEYARWCAGALDYAQLAEAYVNRQNATGPVEAAATSPEKAATSVDKAPSKAENAPAPQPDDETPERTNVEPKPDREPAAFKGEPGAEAEDRADAPQIVIREAAEQRSGRLTA